MNNKSVLMFVAGTVGVLIGIVALLWNFSGSGQGEQVIEGVAGEMRHVMGEGEVVVTEFSDFQCPACSATKPLVDELMNKYEGRVKLVYRHLPLTSIHPNAMSAAIASEAASEQGKFFEMYEILFSKQKEWAELDDPKEKFVEYAKELGLDEEKFRADIESEELKKIVQSDSTDALRYKIQATPSFFVNGVKVETSQLESKIGQQLGE